MVEGGPHRLLVTVPACVFVEEIVIGWARRESNPHAFLRPQGLSPLCLPFHHAPHSDRA